MRILVMWRQGTLTCRNTITDHAFSFKRYDHENEYFYFDIWNGRHAGDYEWITKEMFDVVIFHYSLLALRTSEKFWTEFQMLMQNIWKTYPCIKVMLPQDDYTLTERIWDFCKSVEADYIFSVIREKDLSTVYPEMKVGKAVVKNVLTGYVDERYLNQVELLPHYERKFDVVYRARKLSYEFGKYGQLKWELANVFKQELKDRNLRIDIDNTRGNSGALLGDEWIKFIASSRITVGCLGGSEIIDVRGDIRRSVHEYMKEYPQATYEETQKICFPVLNYRLQGVLSPRIFESALTKTCQVLVGKDYHGILVPDRDYIVLNEDFSNINEVVEKIEDIEYSEKISTVCYHNIIRSGQYTYKKFVDYILREINRRVVKKYADENLSEKIKKQVKKNNDLVLNEMRCVYSGVKKENG